MTTAEDVADKERVPVALEMLSAECKWEGKQFAHYRMKPAIALEPGEYAYIQGGEGGNSIYVFDFAVEQ